MNKKRFRIPLGWEDNPSPQRHWVERLMSDTLVIPIHVKPDPPYEVERVSGSWSPHVPEKVPAYNVWQQRGGRPWRATKFEAVRLAQVSVGAYVVVELDARRPQLCVMDAGHWHGVLFTEDSASAHTYCGRSPYIYRLNREEQQAAWAYDRVPDCPDCAKFKRAWVCLKVYPYEHKREVVKKTDKEAAKAKQRAKMPTAYDRILVDDIFETPKAYKPEVARPPTPEPEPFAELERQERDRKLESARERNQRLKTALRERRAR
jgi:hypothetical protein